MKKAKAIRVLCVDDHPVVRDGLISIIGTQPDMRVIDEASDGREAITKYRQHQPDVVVMDLRMPNLSGVQATRQIRREFPGALIIVLTTYEGDEDIHGALQVAVVVVDWIGMRQDGASNAIGTFDDDFLPVELFAFP